MGTTSAEHAYFMTCTLTGHKGVIVASYEIDAAHMHDHEFARRRLYSRSIVNPPIDVRSILHDQYVNIATWLHRNGAWDQLVLPE